MLARMLIFSAVALTLVGANACTRTVSHGVNERGQVTGLVFPEITKDKQKRAVHPNLENLLKMRQGMTKYDVYHLIGTPHFREMLGAREWDYVFKYDYNNAELYCQYKILFDKDARVGGMYWKPAECMTQMTMPSGQVK